MSPIPIREIREPQAIYYLGEFAFRDGETGYFKLRLKPDADTATLELQFSKTLYVD